MENTPNDTHVRRIVFGLRQYDCTKFSTILQGTCRLLARYLLAIHERRGVSKLRSRAMCALYDSYSFVRVLPALQRRELLGRIAQLVEDRFGGRAPNVVQTPLYTAVAL